MNEGTSEYILCRVYRVVDDSVADFREELSRVEDLLIASDLLVLQKKRKLLIHHELVHCILHILVSQTGRQTVRRPVSHDRQSR